MQTWRQAEMSNEAFLIECGLETADSTAGSSSSSSSDAVLSAVETQRLAALRQGAMDMATKTCKRVADDMEFLQTNSTKD